jgi:hypothetical protein
MLLNEDEMILQFFTYSKLMVPEILKEKELSVKKRKFRLSGEPVINYEKSCSAQYLPETLHTSGLFMKEAFWQLRDDGMYVSRFFLSKNGNPRTENPIIYALQSLVSEYFWEVWAFKYSEMVKTINFGKPCVANEGERPRLYIYTINNGIDLHYT